MDPPHRRPRVLVRRRRDRAGIQHYDLGMLRRVSRQQPAFAELAFHRGAVGLGGPAAKILYVEAGHAPMVTETGSGRLSGADTQPVGPGYADAICRRCWKHSRQNTGRPCVGLNGTVVSLPHCEQLVRVSTRPLPGIDAGATPRFDSFFALQLLHRRGSFLNCLS